MPLLYANKNEELRIVHISADAKTKKHLENLGILQGNTITILSKIGDNLIVKVLESRIAINADLARQIQIG